MKQESSLIVGWREWAKLPSFNVSAIKVKIDTGARTSSLHVRDINIMHSSGRDLVEFTIYPIQKNNIIKQVIVTEVIDMQIVKSSNGSKETRPVVKSSILIGNKQWDINITLTNRDLMKHRMLLGRQAMNNFLINPTKSYCQGYMNISKSKLIPII